MISSPNISWPGVDRNQVVCSFFLLGPTKIGGLRIQIFATGYGGFHWRHVVMKNRRRDSGVPIVWNGCTASKFLSVLCADLNAPSGSVRRSPRSAPFEYCLCNSFLCEVALWVLPIKGGALHRYRCHHRKHTIHFKFRRHGVCPKDLLSRPDILDCGKCSSSPFSASMGEKHGWAKIWTMLNSVLID